MSRKDELEQSIKEAHQEEKTRSAALIVGSGNGETILDLRGDLVIGAKHDVARAELLGGSGVNYALRMARYDPAMRILPILSIGKDRTGERIREEILNAIETERMPHSLLDFVRSDSFFCPGIETAQSTVLTTAQSRTIFRKEQENAEPFRSFVERRISDVQALADVSVRAVMIGHIYADSSKVSPKHEGEITRSIINAYWDKAIVFANFGDSQYLLGHKFWEDDLARLTVFQLSIEEARRFFGDPSAAERVSPSDSRQAWSLSSMMRWFQSRGITAVITLDRFGAVATLRGHQDIWLALAFDLDKFEDATGAGDAFGAGLVYTLCKTNGKITPDRFETALKEARTWSAYACTTRGATSDCPSQAKLDCFRQTLRERDQDPDSVESRDLQSWESIFRILDKAY